MAVTKILNRPVYIAIVHNTTLTYYINICACVCVQLTCQNSHTCMQILKLAGIGMCFMSNFFFDYVNHLLW